MNTHFYSDKLPDIGDLVVGVMTQFENNIISIRLPEFSDVTAYMYVKSIRVRKIKTVVKIGQTMVFHVTKVDLDKEYVELDNRDVDKNETDAIINRFNLFKHIRATGDYQANHHMRGVIPCPGVGLKRRIAKQFKVYNLDEFRTSCLNYKTEERCSQLRVRDWEGKRVSVHSILTYKTENSRHGCIGRYLNAVRNMCKLVNHWLATGERLPNFKRSTTVPHPIC